MSNQHCFDPLHDIETASVDELRALQLQRMKASLQHAYDNIPAYKVKFEEHGVHPEDLQSLEDLARFGQGRRRIEERPGGIPAVRVGPANRASVDRDGI